VLNSNWKLRAAVLPKPKQQQNHILQRWKHRSVCTWHQLQHKFTFSSHNFFSAKEKTQLQKLLQSKMCTHISIGGLLNLNIKSGMLTTPRTESMQRET
jgi:hypothetical protein